IGQNIVNGESFPGLLDEVELLESASSADEIAGLYLAGSVGKCKPTCVPPPAILISWWTADKGEVNLAFKFDGVDDYVLVPDNPSLNYTDFTYDAWIAPDPDSPSGDNYI